MRVTTTMLILALIAGLGCATPSAGPKSAGEASAKTADGLDKVEIEMPGVLFLREGHGIGSYDAFLIPPADINYRRRSSKLSPDMEDEFMAQLEQSLLDGASDAEIPVEDTPGECVIAVAIALINVDLERSSSSKTIGTMTLIMEFRDSMSRETLLRYATQNRIESEGRQSDRLRQIRESFDSMVEGLDITQAFRAAGLSDGQTRPGCDGTLAKRRRAASPGVSSR